MKSSPTATIAIRAVQLRQPQAADQTLPARTSATRQLRQISSGQNLPRIVSQSYCLTRHTAKRSGRGHELHLN